jgi:ribosome-associated protein
LVDKKRSAKPGGRTREGVRPKIPISHVGRSQDPTGIPRPRRRPGSTSLAGSSLELPANGSARPRSAPRRLAPSRAAGARVKRPRTLSAAPTTSSIASDDARALAILIATAALEKKAVSVEVLDVAGKVDYADFLVLMTGRSDRQVQAIAQGIEETLRMHGRRAQSVEGLPHASWVLMDYSDVVVHVFQDQARSAYDLEGLWMDARRIPVPLPEDGSDR